MAEFRCRPADRQDWPAIATINRRAFGGDEEALLVDRLRRDGEVVVELVAARAGEAIGHILFSRLGADSLTGRPTLAALAPLAVLPEWQRQGVGSALMAAGARACRDAGVDAVVVVGHPTYYPRFGFSAPAVAAIRTPYAGPAFMGLDLTPGTLAAVTEVRYPAAFADL
jgi:putative acetyltransferase